MKYKLIQLLTITDDEKKSDLSQTHKHIAEVGVAEVGVCG